MLRKISELDFADVVAQIKHGVNRETRSAADPITRSELSFVHSRADALALLRNYVALAVADDLRVEEVHVDHPLVQALVRCQHDRDAQPIPVAGPLTREIVARLHEIAAAHPEMPWNADVVQELLIKSILMHGDQELDDAQPPELMYWGPASPAATSLIALVTLRELGDL